MKLNAAVATWSAAALILTGGSFGVISASERHIAEQRAANDGLAAQLAADTLLLRSRGSLLAELNQLRANLGQQTGRDSTPVVARFIRDAATTAQREHTTIASIAVASGSGLPQGRGAALASNALSVTVEGHYAAVLAVIRALSALPVPAQIDVVSMVRSTRPGTATVSAVLHAALEPVGSLTPADVRDRS